MRMVAVGRTEALSSANPATPLAERDEDGLRGSQCSNEAGSGAKNQEQEQAGSGAEASAGSQDLLIRPLLGSSV